MTRTAIWLCQNPTGTHWELGSLPPAKGQVALIGWREWPFATDGGVPRLVAETLAGALVRCARVTFLSTQGVAPPPQANERWVDAGDGDFVRSVVASFALDWLNVVLGHAPSRLSLVSTVCGERASSLFSDASHPWWLRSQVAWLTETQAPLPNLKRGDILDSVRKGLDDLSKATGINGLLGMLRPGVDGDVAGLWTIDDDTARRFVKSLQSAATENSADFSLVDEETFMQRLSGTI